MEMVIDPKKPHLGGDIKDGDPKTWCPKLWDTLIPPGSRVLDIGCGEGQALEYMRREIEWCYAIGIDGIPRSAPGILRHDYTTGPYYASHEYEPFDVIWSCEFLEHLEERFLPNVLETFKRGRRLLVTAAAPDQPGHHHVNCRAKEYWKGVFAAIGYHFNSDLTAESLDWAPGTWWEENGMIFDFQGEWR